MIMPDSVRALRQNITIVIWLNNLTKSLLSANILVDWIKI